MFLRIQSAFIGDMAIPIPTSNLWFVSNDGELDIFLTGPEHILSSSKTIRARLLRANPVSDPHRIDFSLIAIYTIYGSMNTRVTPSWLCIGERIHRAETTVGS